MGGVFDRDLIPFIAPAPPPPPPPPVPQPSSGGGGGGGGVGYYGGYCEPRKPWRFHSLEELLQKYKEDEEDGEDEDEDEDEEEGVIEIALPGPAPQPAAPPAAVPPPFLEFVPLKLEAPLPVPQTGQVPPSSGLGKVLAAIAAVIAVPTATRAAKADDSLLSKPPRRHKNPISQLSNPLDCACRQCGHTWMAKGARPENRKRGVDPLRPKLCPKCRSPYWDIG